MITRAEYDKAIERAGKAYYKTSGEAQNKRWRFMKAAWEAKMSEVKTLEGKSQEEVTSAWEEYDKTWESRLASSRITLQKEIALAWKVREKAVSSAKRSYEYDKAIERIRK